MTQKISDYIEHGVNLGKRIVYVTGDIDQTSAHKVMVALDAMSGSQAPVTVKILTEGGCLYSGLAIYHAIRQFPGEVTTIACGAAMSSGGIILQAGDRRMMQPMATLMYHFQTETLEASSEAFEKWGRATKRYRKYMVDILVERTGKTARFWQEKLRSDFIVSPEEALKLNLVDEVLD